MEQTITTTITGVQPRKVTRKKDNKEVTFYDVHTSDSGTWTTSLKKVAQEAFELKGQIVQINTKTDTQGMYENNWLQGVMPADGDFIDFDTPATPEARQHIPQQQQQQRAQLPEPPPEKDYQAHPVLLRRDAAKVSAQISDTANEFWANLDDLVSYFESGGKPGQSEDDIPF